MYWSIFGTFTFLSTFLGTDVASNYVTSGVIPGQHSKTAGTPGAVEDVTTRGYQDLPGPLRPTFQAYVSGTSPQQPAKYGLKHG